MAPAHGPDPAAPAHQPGPVAGAQGLASGPPPTGGTVEIGERDNMQDIIERVKIDLDEEEIRRLIDALDHNEAYLLRISTFTLGTSTRYSHPR